MTPDLHELRGELRWTSVLGPSQVDADNLIERRGGRYLPAVEVSKGELDALKVLSELAEHAYYLSFALPNSGQLDRITFDPKLGCWNLPVRNIKVGTEASYGRMHVSGIAGDLGHRTMYAVFFGAEAFPNGRHDFLDHICETKTCCYPRHLERVPSKENSRRGRVQISHDHPRLI